MYNLPAQHITVLRTILATETAFICSASFVGEQARAGRYGVRCVAGPTNRLNQECNTL
jgi:hypothetical protein